MFSLNQAAEHLSRAVQFATVSYSDPSKMDLALFSAFEAYLEEAYPLLHQKLDKTVVNSHALVFRWPGKGSGRRILLTAHYDVVPASSEGWPCLPFSGLIQEGRIYGRGSFDDKSSLITILEAVTALLEEGFTPPCEIWLAFGYDEEVGGALGAQKIAAWFEQQGLSFDYVLDEGGAVADGSMMGITKPVAVIGIAEKGNTSFELTFEGEGGHSSTPPAETAAMLRTTAAFTMARGGVSHNVLPTEASCTVNLRLLQGDSIEKALARFRSLGIPFQMKPLLLDEPTGISDLEGPAMEHLRRCIAKTFPDAVITPYLMVGGTDCRHYDKVTRNSYRFQPARVSEKELSLMHGKGEYLSLQNLQTMVEFYMDFIRLIGC